MNRQPFPARHRKAVVASFAVLAAAAGLGIWAITSGTRTTPPRPIVNNVSGRPTACLASDSATAHASDTADKLWAAMGQHKTGANIQQLILPAADRTQAQPLLAGLINQHCNLIITIGKPFGESIDTLAQQSPETTFIAVDSGLPSTPHNTTLTTANDAETITTQQLQKLNQN